MAASSLQDILATEPGLAAKIDEMTELLPGVPASKQNLKTLLDHLMKRGYFDLGGNDDTSIQFHVAKLKRKKDFMVKVLGKAEVVRRADFEFNERPCVCGEVFPCTEEGFLEGLLYAKQNRKRYRDEGPCLDCVRSHESHPPKKKLKAKGMPKCEECMIKAIVAE